MLYVALRIPAGPRMVELDVIRSIESLSKKPELVRVSAVAGLATGRDKVQVRVATVAFEMKRLLGDRRAVYKLSVKVSGR